MRCQGCGVDKDPAVPEVYPFPDECRLTTNPIPPFFQLDCQDYEGKKESKTVTVCHRCFSKLDPDMWIARGHWESINPVVPFDHLLATRGPG
jgi:hypothetical protein